MIKIDTNKYATFSFEEIASNISERVEPHDTDLEIYVGLEHLDPECIHIKRKGVPADVKGTKLRVYPGDIIFGKRRAYQRKAGLVDFDGICSAHAMVVRANPDVILPELFPFFIHSDVFMHRAVDVSEGSLSPTIKWKILAEEKFKLPSLTEQKRLADLLWSVDEAVEKNKRCFNELQILKASKTKQIFFNISDEGIELGKLCVEKPSYGATASAVKFKERKPRYIRITDISEEGDLKDDDIKGIGAKDFEKYRLEEGDLLIARTAAVGRAFVYREIYGDCVYAGYLIKFRINNEKALPEYVFCYLQSPIFQNWVRKTTRTGLQANINAKEYSDHILPVPSLKVQKKIVEHIQSMKNVECRFLEQINNVASIQKQIINQIFGQI